MKVVLTDHVYPDLDYEWERLAEVGAELVFIDSGDEAVIAEAARDADALIVCFAEITDKVISTMNRCRIIARTGIGVNNIAIKKAAERGIMVTNVPDYCVDEVSDHSVALMLSLARRIPMLNARVKSGEWRHTACGDMPRLRGKTLGLLGFGRIARLVGKKMQAMGLSVLAYDPFVGAKAMSDMGVRKAALDKVYESADFISLNLPLLETTHGMIDRAALRKMKRSAIVVNTARGPLVNEADLYQALTSGEIAAFGSDVLCDEARIADNPLLQLENFVITPHAAFFSPESTRELREKVMDCVLDGLRNVKPKYLVNQ